MQEECNEYERSRNARIAQNAAKLRALEIQDKVSSLIGHSESRKRSNKMKSKEKEKTNRYQEEDLEYISSHSEEEFDPLSFEVPKKVAQSSSQRRVRYIPPRSMTNFSSVAKRLAFQNQDLSIDSHQRSPTECLDAERGQRHESNAASLSQKRNGNKMTMADLILEKKSTSRANEAATYQLDRTPVTSFDENGISTGPYTSSRARVVVQRESTRTISHDNALELNKSDSNTDNDDDVPFNYGQESEHSDDESTDEMLDLNGRDLELEAILNKKSRGPTMLHHVHMRPFEKRKAIILNEFGQPIGPISKEEDTVAEFSRFLGTIARDYDYAPIVVYSWRKIPNKEKMWEYVLMKYNVPEEGKEWVVKTIASACRLYKCRFKRKHYYQYKDDKARWQHRSKRVPDADFLKLLAIWKKNLNRCVALVTEIVVLLRRICILPDQKVLQLYARKWYIFCY